MNIPAAMCLVLAAVRVVPGHPLVLVANRDEYFDRPAEPPRDRGGDPRAWHGVDLRAGGTWLGVNEAGVVAALTNQPGRNDPLRPSRGRIPLAALRGRSALQGQSHASLLPGGGHNANALLVGDARHAFYSAECPGFVGRTLGTVELPPGLHTFTNTHPLDALPASTVLAAIDATPETFAAARSLDEAFALLRRVAASHVPIEGTRAPCVHGDGRGTVSSALVALADDGAIAYLHAQGAPCVADYVRVL